MGSFLYFENDEIFDRGCDYNSLSKIGTNDGLHRIFLESGKPLIGQTDVFRVEITIAERLTKVVPCGLFRISNFWVASNSLARQIFPASGKKQVTHLRLLRWTMSTDCAYVGGSIDYAPTPPRYLGQMASPIDRGRLSVG